MTTSTWNDGTADWYTNNGGDWTPAGDPGPSSAVVINSGEPELESGDAAISVASISIGGGTLYIQDPGKTQSVSGNVSLTSGALIMDQFNADGGSQLSIGGTLTNSGTINVGPNNNTLSAADTITAAGLANTGTINLWGSATEQATLHVSAPAGFGTAGVLSGDVNLNGGKVLLEFASGQIATIAASSELSIAGTTAFLADATGLTSNSALTGLSTITGQLFLYDGATVSTSKTNAAKGDLTVTGLVDLDQFNANGGAQLSVGGTLTNSGTIDVGPNNNSLSAADTITAAGLANTGTINLYGSSTAQATLDVSAPAGFGTAGVLSGDVNLNGGKVLLEFASGEIATIAASSELSIAGTTAFLADATGLTSNSALTGLSTITGQLFLYDGATVSTSKTNAAKGDLTVTGLVDLDQFNANGGAQLSVGGTLTNSGTIDVGPNNNSLSAADTITAAGLANTGTINLYGSSTAQATLDVSAPAGFGTAGVLSGDVNLNGGKVLLEFASGEIKTIAANSELSIAGTTAFLADATGLTSNSALTGLSTITGQLFLYDGASVSTSKKDAAKGDLTVTGLVDLDQFNADGGAQLSVGGTLTNSGTIDVGPNNNTLSAADTITAAGLSNTGTINLWGSATEQATLHVSASAGFGAAGVLSGDVNLNGGKVLLEFASGEITTIAANSELSIAGTTAFLADATGLTSNSALTGLSTITGQLFLYDGASVSTSKKDAAKGDLTVTGLVDLDQFNADGGAQLSVGGTLTNSGTIDVGPNNNTLSAADTITAAGLANTGTINLWGSATAQAKLSVTGVATSSGGTIYLGAFSDLTAATVDITGGTLEGVGTVTGTLNDTGGTVVGGNLNSTTGTLTEHGAYEQSGSGVLQTDINTGDSQPSSIIRVTGTPGTPGASGSVNLAGGKLLIDAQTSLALNTPYTVMTFGADDLYGQFGGVETEGSLGSHTGNGDSVNLGNGDTLEVLYNEASGDVQVEVVTTPASPTYTWDVGSGTWNASSGADWNPPGNGTVPSQSSNVTIGTGGGGTVTLAQDQTIASLSITNGYTLSGATKSITTIGSVSVASGAVLSIDDMNVGTTFADDGSATFAGYLTINGSGQFTLSNGTLSGGINGTGTFETVADTTGTLENITISKGTTYTASNGATTDISGTMAGQGTLQVNGGDGNNGYLVLTGAMTLSGGGALSLTTVSGGGMALVQGNGETLTNASDVIEGTGEIGNSSLKLINGGTIDADSPAGTGTLILNGSGGTTNADGTTGGLMEATSGGTLEIDDITIDNLRGKITADGGTVELVGGAVVEGGTLSELSSGTLETGSGQTATLNGTTHGALTISAGSTYTASNNETTYILGTITDKGTIQVIGGDGDNGILYLKGATTLSGGGTVSLTSASGGGGAYVETSGETLTNADTIEGTGTIGNGSLTVINGGTIDADSSAGTGILVLDGSGGITNANGATAGLLEATSGGTLEIDDITVNNAGDAITANDGTVQVLDATIQGGTLNTLGGGTMASAGTTATLDGSTNGALTISAGTTYTASNDETTYILGTIIDKGTIQLIGGDGDNGILYLNAATTLSGGGVVTMTSATGGGGAYVEDNGETLTNADTIEGTGTVGNGTLAVINGGTIDVDSSAGTGILVLDGSGGITNANGATAGLLEATSGGTLEIDDITVNNAGGAITANDGTVQVLDATIQGGTLNALGGGTMASAGTTATLDGSTNGALTISAGTTYTASNDETTYILGTIIDKGTIQLNGGDGDNGIVYLNGATTLSGGGTLSLTSASGGGGAYVEDDGETLTNADTIEGIGIIGNGSLALTSSGTINANSSAGTLTLNGTGGITNTGVFEATAGGHLYVDGALSGAGQLKIGANAEVELGGATSENTTFLSATAATLLIDNATTTTYAGVISSFAKGDILELGNTDATKATPTFNSGPDTTTLTVDLSSGGPLVYTLAGNLSSDTFGVTVSGSNSSIAITADPAFEEAASLLGGHTASPFVESSGVFGASNTAGSAQLNLAGSLHAHSLT